MFITAFILFAWSAACWFSQPFEESFLGLPIFDIDPAFPFIGSLLFLGLGFVGRIGKIGAALLSLFRERKQRDRKTILVLCLILLVGLVVQIPSLVLIKGSVDSDSALYGLASYHIADGKGRPIFAYGRHHIGMLIPHVAALVHLSTGKAPISMGVINILFYLGSLVFLFLLVWRLIGRKQALLTAALVAIPPFFVYDRIKYVEFAEIFFWGNLSLLVLSHLLKEDKPRPRAYFWYGVVLGIGYYAHPQMIYFIGTGLLALFIRNKLFLFNPGIALALAGFILGAAPAVVDNYFNDWVQVKGLFAREMMLGEHSKSFLAGSGEFVGHIGNLLGSNPLFFGSALFHPWFNWLAVGLLAACLVIFTICFRTDAVKAITLKNHNAGPLIFIIFFLVVFFVFSLSSFSKPPAPVRYLLPLWTAIPVIIASAAVALARWKKVLAVPLVVFFGVIFFCSQLLMLIEYYSRERDFSAWESLCGAEGITHFYGQFWKAFNTSYLTREEIIGSTIFHSGPEYYRPYQQEVRLSGDSPAFLFDGKHYDPDSFERRLKQLGIRFEYGGSPYGVLFHSLSERVTAGQLSNLLFRKYEAAISFNSAGSYEISPAKRSLEIVEFAVKNTGEVDWRANGDGGFIELVAVNARRGEIRRQPLVAPVSRGSEISWRMVLERMELMDGPLSVFVTANGIVINTRKQALTLTSEEIEKKKNSQRRDPGDSINEINVGDSLRIRDYNLLRGWGVVSYQQATPVFWSGDGESVFGIVLPEPYRLRLTMKLLPFRVKTLFKGEAQEVEVAVNGKDLPDRVSLARASIVTIEIPRGVLRTGLNRIRLKYKNIEPRFRLEGKRMILRYRPQAAGLMSLRIR